jgi:hypothetical protein
MKIKWPQSVGADRGRDGFDEPLTRLPVGGASIGGRAKSVFTKFPGTDLRRAGAIAKNSENILHLHCFQYVTGEDFRKTRFGDPQHIVVFAKMRH